MIEINALYPSGERKNYYMSSNQYDEKCKEIITTAEEEDIFLKIYFVRSNGKRELVFDSLLNQIMSEVVLENLSITHA